LPQHVQEVQGASPEGVCKKQSTELVSGLTSDE
jgi:hypothetical protein